MSLPRIPLSDGAGEVVEVGPQVTSVRPGDRVLSCLLQGWQDGQFTHDAARTGLGAQLDGVLCDYAVFHEEGIVACPPHLSYEQACTLPCAALTAWHALAEGNVHAGQTVVCLGTGGVSAFAIQFAKMLGARVIVTSKSDAKLARARELGAHATINYQTHPEWDRVVRELTEGAGADHLVEVGGAGTLPLSLKATRHGGRIALIGVLAGANMTFNPLPAVMKGIAIQGIFVGSRAMFERMNRAAALHGLTPVIDRVFDFDNAVAAFEHLASGDHFGKIVIRMV